MRIYSVSHREDDSGSGILREWFPSKRAAQQRIAELRRRDKENPDQSPADPSDKPDPHDIKLTRRDLLHFLNIYANNG